ncbi:hypothetical protein [Ensifer sesbaniae]|uniref:hypothetical protein n=1 Tax=Ensifer sesbaniae TaxID=1214071 RepID=UPI001FE2B77E|nr:hypothetical protein [Ensifer sesbaniae]NRQ13465.1 hypothetical protein [Ensifer sesbaniae]
MSNPFSFYAGMRKPDTTQNRQQLAEQLQAKIMGQPMPQNTAEGIGALMTGIAAGAAKRNAAFPVAPGGAKPSALTGLANFFTMGRNGGLN